MCSNESLALRRSGEASKAAAGAALLLVPHNSCSQCCLFFPLLSASGSSRFLKCCQPISPTPSQTENSKWRLKTTMGQLCQHEHPSRGKHFYGNRQGASANTCTYSHTRRPRWQWNIRLHSPLQHLSYLHATRRSHAHQLRANTRAGCPALGTRHTH